MGRIWSQSKTALGRTYIRPWKDGTRAFLLLAALPGLCAAGLQEVALVYNITGFGLVTATLFHVARMLLMGFVIIPAAYWLLEKPAGKPLLLTVQSIGILLFLIDPASAILNALACALSIGPFWAVFSQRLSQALSRDNHGHETALLNYLQTILIAGGTFAGGWLLKIDAYTPAMLGAGAAILFSTALYAQPLPVEDRARMAARLIGLRKPATRLSLGVSVMYALANNALPTWMRLIGLSPLSAGAALALRPLLGLVLAPLAGHLVQKGGLNAARAGGAALMLGWGLIALALRLPPALPLGLGLLAVGAGLIAPLEINRWFKRRRAGAILAREWILGAGRTLALGLVIPLAFWLPLTVPLCGAALGLGFVLGGKKKAPPVKAGLWG